ncbi:MAG: hypothetical protein JXA18_02810 [Chitinispirillaceae bacterium]|nr:hypothetical protein [Chitinispirillaceae bacterium]
MSYSAPQPRRQEMKQKKFLGVHFQCCKIYQRIYRNPDGTAYDGCCPRCGKRVHFPIGEDGIENRFFEAY